MSETPHWSNAPEIAPTEAYDELPPRLLRKLKVSVPGYKLEKVIARGGQAIVIKGVQQATGKAVAIKLLREGPLADSSARARLQREVAVMATLNHPNIVTVIDSGVTPGGLDYLAMDFVDGEPLYEFLKDNRTEQKPENDAGALLRLFVKICEAINAAHRRGIVHRDLSPSNIMVDSQGEPKILDFGLARTAFDRFIAGSDRSISITGQFLGKLAYASPEQARGEPDKIDIRTDVYALGVILYQILTGGEFPYKVVGSIVEVLGNIVNEAPTPPSERLAAKDADQLQRKRRLRKRHPPLVNAVMEAIVLKALEKNPDQRYQSAGEFGRDIENYLAGQPTVARISEGASMRFSLSGWMPTTAAFSRLLSRRSIPTWWRIGLACGLMGLVIAGIVVSRRSGTAPQEVSSKNAVADPPAPTSSVNAPAAPESSVSAPATPKPQESKVVDLIKLVDVQKDVSAGKWQLQDGLLYCQQGGNPAIEFPYVPPEEYDFQLSFLRPEGSNVMRQVCFAAGRQFEWCVGNSWWSWFAYIDGKGLNPENPTGTKYIASKESPERYVSLVKVRRDGVTAYINDKLVRHYATDYSRLSLAEKPLHHTNTLGLVINGQGIVVESAEVVEITGHGQLLR